MAIVVAGGDRSFEAEGRWMTPGPSPSLLPEGRTVEAVLLREGAGGGAIRSSDGDAPNGGGGWRRRPSPPVAGRASQARVYSPTYRHREIYPGDGPWKGQGSPASPGRIQPVVYPPGENAGIPPDPLQPNEASRWIPGNLCPCHRDMFDANKNVAAPHPGSSRGDCGTTIPL